MSFIYPSRISRTSLSFWFLRHRRFQAALFHKIQARQRSCQFYLSGGHDIVFFSNWKQTASHLMKSIFHFYLGKNANSIMTRWQIMTCIYFFGKGAPHIVSSPFNGLYHTTCTCLKIRMTSIFQLSILKKPHERCFKLVLLENLSWRAALFSFFKAAAKWAIFFISDQIEFTFRVLPSSLVPETPPQNT